MRSFLLFVVLSGRLSNPTHELERLLNYRTSMTSKKKGSSADAVQGLTDAISSESRTVHPRQLTRLKPLDKAEILARAWKGQTSAELAQMFKVTPRTINRVIRESKRT